jgi:hypothetical protein
VTPKRRIEQDGTFLVYGPHGVISWQSEWRPDDFGPIEIHSPRRLPRNGNDEPDTGCPHMEVGCFHDAESWEGFYLGQAWEKAGRDASAVWPVLEDWYRRELAGGDR